MYFCIFHHHLLCVRVRAPREKSHLLIFQSSLLLLEKQGTESSFVSSFRRILLYTRFARHFPRSRPATDRVAQLRNGYELSVHAAAHFTRGELAYALRSSPYFVNLLLGGWDKENGASLYFLDYLASMNQMNYAVHGYASYFLYSLLDRHYKPKMSLEEGMQLLDLCFRELETRFVINTRNYIVKVADKDGVRVLRDASAAAEPAAQPKPLHSA